MENIPQSAYSSPKKKSKNKKERKTKLDTLLDAVQDLQKKKSKEVIKISKHRGNLVKLFKHFLSPTNKPRANELEEQLENMKNI